MDLRPTLFPAFPSSAYGIFSGNRIGEKPDGTTFIKWFAEANESHLFLTSGYFWVWLSQVPLRLEYVLLQRGKTRYITTVCYEFSLRMDCARLACKIARNLLTSRIGRQLFLPCLHCRSICRTAVLARRLKYDGISCGCCGEVEKLRHR